MIKTGIFETLLSEECTGILQTSSHNKLSVTFNQVDGNIPVDFPEII